MPAWRNVYGEGLKVRYHIYLAEDGIVSDFVDKIEIVSEDGSQILVKYYAEEGILFVNSNGNKIWFYSPTPSFTYLHNLEELSAEEIVSLVKHEISYLLSLALS